MCVSLLSTGATRQAASSFTAQNYTIRINGTSLGRSVCTVQIIDLVGPDGRVVKVCCLYDGGSDCTVVSSELRDYFHSSDAVQYTFVNANQTQYVNGNLVSMYYKDGGGLNHQFFALSQQISSSFQNAKEFWVLVEEV